MRAHFHAARLLQPIAFSLLLTPLCIRSVGAQGSSLNAHASHLPTVVILGVDSQTSVGRGRVLVRGTGSPTEVIVVPLTADVSDLAEAFKIVRTTRARLKSRDSTVLQRIDLGKVKPRRALSAAERSAYSVYLRAFSTAPVIAIPGAGRGRRVQVDMPN